MRISGWIVVAAALGLMGSPAQGKGLPLPEETEIPDDYATLLCPDVAAGKDVLANYLIPGPQFVDTTTFLAGVEANGCAYQQDRVGPIQIEAVLDRRNAQPGETYIVYRGTMADGTEVIGILHEEGHNEHPRNPFEQFLAYNTQDGVITVMDGERGAFVCPAPDGAIATVDAIAVSSVADEQFAALETAVADNGCVPAVGAFQITEMHGEAYIDGGFEAEEAWTALSAVDQGGRPVGLLYDASPFR